MDYYDLRDNLGHHIGSSGRQTWFKKTRPISLAMFKSQWHRRRLSAVEWLNLATLQRRINEATSLAGVFDRLKQNRPSWFFLLLLTGPVFSRMSPWVPISIMKSTLRLWSCVKECVVNEFLPRPNASRSHGKTSGTTDSTRCITDSDIEMVEAEYLPSEAMGKMGNFPPTTAQVTKATAMQTDILWHLFTDNSDRDYLITIGYSNQWLPKRVHNQCFYAVQGKAGFPIPHSFQRSTIQTFLIIQA